jgi:hypothetical protein
LLFQPLHELELALGDLADASLEACQPMAVAPLPHQAVEAVRVEAAAQYQVLEEAAVEHLAPSP